MASGFLLRGFVHADSSSLTAGAQVFGLLMHQQRLPRLALGSKELLVMQ